MSLDYNLKVDLRPPQKAIFNDRHRHKVVVAGARFGKTILGLSYLISQASAFHLSKNWYICPTRDLAKRIAWGKLKQMLGMGRGGDAPLVRNVYDGDLIIEMCNGATIELHSAQEPERLVGRAIKTVVLDEYAEMDTDVWPNIRPRLGDKALRLMYGELGRTLTIGTPSGYNHFKELFDKVRAMPEQAEWRAWRYTSTEGMNIDATEIENAKLDLDPKMFRQEYEATFESIEGRCYHQFLRDYYARGELVNCGNLDDSVHDPGQGPVLVGMDFNVNPMCAVLATKVSAEREFLKPAGGQAQRHGAGAGMQEELHVWREYRIPDCNTDTMMRAIRADYPDRHLVVFPDPTGNQRHTTSANVGQTDHAVIKSYHADIYIPKFRTNSDKYNCVNAMLCNAKGHRRLLVNQRACTNLVNGLDGLTFVEGSNLPNKKTGLDHQTDALAYSVVGAFPIVRNTISESTVIV